jgi:trk system potassium uptake protein TrkH
MVVTGSSMLLPAFCSIYYHEADLLPIIISAFIAITIGVPSWWKSRKQNELHIKDSIFIAVSGWFLVYAVSALPFMIHG